MSEWAPATAKTIKELVVETSALRLLTILWTILLGVAVARDSKDVLCYVWPYLFWTWVALLALFLVTEVIARVLKVAKIAELPESDIKPRPGPPAPVVPPPADASPAP